MSSQKLLVVLACVACLVVIVAGTAVFVRQVQSGPEATITIDGLGEFGAGGLGAMSEEERAAIQKRSEDELMQRLTKEERERLQRVRAAMKERGIWVGPDDLLFFAGPKIGFVFLEELGAAGLRTDQPEDKFAQRLELSNEEKFEMATKYDAIAISRLQELADKVASKTATPAELEEAKRHTVLRHVVEAAAE